MVQGSVSVAAPGGSGGRRVCFGGRFLGTAYSLHELTLLLRDAGLVRGDELDVAESGLIEWYGGGPEVWPRQGGGPDCWAGPGGPLVSGSSARTTLGEK
ncbi:hypothetical protein ABZ619_27580 [Streptomyces sp. NPDC007851]|uniref:hypothetical protein n=1 Tax=Streptomyces sp. NPDC007851 TaxID=3155008 RepID=UPI0033C26799